MNEWLFNILKDGTLVDNQSYVINQGVLTNRRLKEPIALNAAGRQTRPCHKEALIWSFLNGVSRDVENSLQENPADVLVLFNDGDYEHNTDDGFIGVSGTDARNFTLTTGNLVGFVKRGDYALKVSSRFGDSFLQYIIADADGFLELENIGGEKHGEGYEWLLAYLWSIKLKKAYRLGLPKTYVTRKDRVSRVRGSIDSIDYFQNKQSGNYLCTYREHSYESPATSLFIEAFKVAQLQYDAFFQQTRNIYNALLVANQGIKRNHQELLNTPYFTNPFYSDYNALIDLSKKIINRQSSQFDADADSSAFFFDIAMLFEYFVRKLIKREGMRLLDKFAQAHRIPTGANGGYMRKLEPDLVFETDAGLYVFDVKYKSFDFTYGVKREDLFQLHTYIGQYGNNGVIKGCGFIYPVSQSRWDQFNLEESQGLIDDDDVIHQQGVEIPFYVIFFKIPDSASPEFNTAMKASCCKFMDTIKSKVLRGV